jgi:deoxyribodipyrimidine photolyase-related protein
MTGAFAAAAVRLAPPGFASSGIVLGDQLDAQSSAFDDFDAEHDAVWMVSGRGSPPIVWSAPLAHCPYF